MLTAVTGINWGDEGKGRVIDLLAEQADIVVRYQGGNNAGHTVVTDKGKFVLNLLPSGILHPDVVCVLGDGMVIDLEHLSNEAEQIKEKGISVTPDNLKLSKHATISMPWHKVQDELEENRLSATGSAFGSTRRGIAYAYSDKYRKKTLRLADLLHLDNENVKARLKTILDAKNLELAGCYHQEPMSYPALLSWCEKQADIFRDYICDTGIFLNNALADNKKVVLEAQLGAMRDIDYGIFPYTSSSSTIAAYGPLGAGIPYAPLNHIVGVLKAYSTCVGAGPFVAENAMSEEWQKLLRKYGGEYGAATGRPRRVGPFDAVASAYGLKCQNSDLIALTKLDILSYMREIPIITGYKYKNTVVTEFDPTDNIDMYKPVVELMPGWLTDISKYRLHIHAKMAEKEITSEQVEGVGIGVPGPVLDSRVVPIICANLGGWGERNVSAQLSGLLDGMKVLVGNDANVAALGEIWMGTAKGCRSAVMVTLGTGVGGGVIVNGKVIDGAHGAGGEIGHITVNRHETATCGCGKHGCLEQYSSATGVVRCMKKLLDENPDADCVLRGKDFEAKDVFDAARSGDALAAREVDEMTDTLGMALASIASTTDPEMFLIGGGVARAGDVLFDPLVEHFKTYAFKSCRETPIKAASLGNDAGIYGAVRLIVGE